MALGVGLSNFNESAQGRKTLGQRLRSWNLMPDSKAKPQPQYIPPAIVEDYKEACLIVQHSPKAAATLARRCLQGMIRDFWGIKKARLVDEIAALEEHVRREDWEAIDAVRHFGNIGAHMEKDVDLIIPVEEKEVSLLIELVEQLFLDWYVDRHSRQQRAARIVALSKEKKALLKGGDAGPPSTSPDAVGSPAPTDA